MEKVAKVAIGKKRLSIFIVYDQDGILDDYIFFLLDELKKVSFRLVIVVNGFVQEDYYKKLLYYSNEIFRRKNSGFDGGAYKQVLLEYLPQEELYKYDELLLINDTFFGPFYSLNQVFENMEKTDYDIWGLTKHEQFAEEYHIKSEHIQSFFMVIRNRVLLSDTFWKFWADMREADSFISAVDNFEIDFSQKMKESGFVLGAYVTADKYISNDVRKNYNYTQVNCGEMIRDYNFPILKRKCLIDGFQGSDTTQIAMEYIRENTSYDVNMIWQNVLRKYDMADISKSISLQYIIPEDTSYEVKGNQGESAIILLIHAKEQIRYIADYLNKLELQADLFMIGVGEKVSKEETQSIKTDTNIINKDYMSDEQIIFSECKSVLETYKYICVLSDEAIDVRRQCDIEPYQKDGLYGCLSNVRYILSLFERETSLGILFPSVMNEVTLPWTAAQYQATERFCNQYNLPLRFHIGKRRMPGRTSFWCRTSSLYNTIAADEFASFTDNEWRQWMLCLPYIIQANGYYSGYISTMKQSEAMISHKDQQITDLTDLNRKYSRLVEFSGKLIAKNARHRYIYGCGIVAQDIYELCNEAKINIDGFIISDSQTKPKLESGEKVIWLSEYHHTDDSIIIIGVGRKLRDEIIASLEEKSYSYMIL